MSFQEHPRAPQERPKSAPRAPQERPRAAKSGPRAAKSGQERPKSGQEPPKSGPRAAQGGPERPKAAQERPKAAQERPRKITIAFTCNVKFMECDNCNDEIITAISDERQYGSLILSLPLPLKIRHLKAIFTPAKLLQICQFLNRQHVSKHEQQNERATLYYDGSRLSVSANRFK